MTDKPSTEKSIEKRAENALRQYARDYAATILLNAKIVAYRNNSKEVQISHIEEALQNISKSKKQFWSRDLLITIGGALFGAFIQGFITEISNKNMTLVVIYVLLGFIGMFLVFWGLSR